MVSFNSSTYKQTTCDAVNNAIVCVAMAVSKRSGKQIKDNDRRVESQTKGVNMINERGNENGV